jgi:ATP/maltotriose-dependent transcriptional regulator MalT
MICRSPARKPRRFCATWTWPKEALEYSIAAGDVDSAAGLVEKLWLPTLWQGRVTTLQRWFGWLDQHGGFEGHPMVALAASILSAATGRPAEAERWADLADHLLHEDEARSIYRKLGASTRSQAVAQARELGLLGG